jgi:ribosomal protein S28E/S33
MKLENNREEDFRILVFTTDYIYQLRVEMIETRDRNGVIRRNPKIVREDKVL